ncbi:probable helicase with zinc finger domain [Neodiprion fabricii]|uniref:probable helicase with zinc finger domain n=1 Tax=Neodiprion fabricii TaxID=2872261 RepID=UPI001ED98425|nr:probable helicase with zinc finger domain [Neodiprion fabricii]
MICSPSKCDEVMFVQNILPNFSKLVETRWFTSDNPESVMSDAVDNVVVFVDGNLNLRFCSKCTQHVWTFEVLTIGKSLENVSLMLDNHREHFTILSVKSASGNSGLCNGQEWFKASAALPGLDLNYSSTNRYKITIGFKTDRYGTYRQTVIFGFGGYPVLAKQISVDCIPIADVPRIEEARRIILSQNMRKWTKSNSQIIAFESPFVPAKDIKEVNLTKAYPFPDETNFYLTHDTLTEESLTPTNYRGRMHELVSIEELARHEQVARYNIVTQLRLCQYYIVAPDADCATTAKYAPSGELFAQLPLGREISEDSKSGRLVLRGCNRVLFKPVDWERSDNQPQTVFEAHIEDKCNRIIYLRLSKHCIETLHLQPDTDVTVQVQFQLNRLPYCEWHRSIDRVIDTSLIFPTVSEDTVIPWDSKEYWSAQFDQKLNVKQKQAVMAMIAPINIILPPILLVGPFGTGKTYTLAQGIRMILNKGPEHKVLLCTHSNSAADLYVKDFFDAWYKETLDIRMKPLRIYYKGRFRNTVHPVVQEYCLMDENGRFREPTKDDVLRCGLIIATLATSSCLASLDCGLTHIIVDEAAQAMECEALTALTLARSTTRLILAGDQMQLAPELYSDLANERGLGLSLLERICNLYPPIFPCKILLCQNYRAHSTIIGLTSELFYAGQVVGCGKHLAHPIFNPLTFFSVQGQDVQGMHSTGFYNDAEAFEVTDRIAELKSCWPTEQWGPYGEGAIGVVAHYAEQVSRIRMELRKRKLFDISVERVMNVQGKQFRAVFISTVRTRNSCQYSTDVNIRDFGFLSNPRLLNTSITRAKCLVAIIGDPVALLTIGSCQRVWEKFFTVATLYGIDYGTLRRYVDNLPQTPQSAPLNPLAKEFIPRSPQPRYQVEYVPIPVPYPVIYCNSNNTQPTTKKNSSLDLIQK